MKRSGKMQELVEKLEAKVHDSPKKLIEACAIRWTTENLGQGWPEVNSYEQLLEIHMDGTGGMDRDEIDEVMDGLEEELKSWREEAVVIVDDLMERGLELTLGNAELAFNNELPAREVRP